MLFCFLLMNCAFTKIDWWCKEQSLAWPIPSPKQNLTLKMPMRGKQWNSVFRKDPFQCCWSSNTLFYGTKNNHSSHSTHSTSSFITPTSVIYSCPYNQAPQDGFHDFPVYLCGSCPYQSAWHLSWNNSYHFSLMLLLLSCFSSVWLCDSLDCSPPGSSVHGIFQARILEWVAISLSKGSSRPKDQTHGSYVSYIGKRILYH